MSPSSSSSSCLFLVLCLILTVSLATAQQSTPLSSSCSIPSNLTNCRALTACSDCSGLKPTAQNGFLQCAWCQSKKVCENADSPALLNISYCPSGWCSGTKGCEAVCECSTWLPCSPHWGGQVILMLFYGFILSYGAKMIGDGSELLLEIMDPGIIGGLVLPVLGAVPDAMMVLASGIAGSHCDAETQLQIGMGTLAGSTIMLNTLVWGTSVFLGRCDIQHGEARDRVCTHPLNTRAAWLHSGVTVDHDTLWNARIMVTVTLSYFIVQGVAFAYLADPDGSAAQSVEGWCALAAFIVCVILLAMYCTYQLMNPSLQEKKIEAARAKYRKQLTVERWLHTLKFKSGSSSVTSPLLGSTNNAEESAPTPAPVDVRSVGLRWKTNAAAQAQQKREEMPAVEEEEEEEDDEVSGMTKQQIAIKAATLLTIGTALVTLFSDPMVEVIDNFGITTGIPAFLLSFILTPVCSNASEIISSFMMALKKRRKNISLTFSQVYGAATMNATFVAAVFYALVSFRNLPWTYSAETLSIVLVSWLVGIPGSFFHTFPLWSTIHVILLYPLSLAFVYLLEQFAGWT